MNPQDLLCILLLPEKFSSTRNARAAPVPLIPITYPPLSCVGEVFQVQGCISIWQFPILRISMCTLLHEVATSYRTISLWGLNSFKSVHRMSGDHCSAHRVNQTFYFLISKAGPSKARLLSESPYTACFSSLTALVWERKKQRINSIPKWITLDSAE